jgi:hypothetical protein
MKEWLSCSCLGNFFEIEEGEREKAGRIRGKKERKGEKKRKDLSIKSKKLQKAL